MTIVCLKCFNNCYVHDGGAYCPHCGATDAKDVNKLTEQEFKQLLINRGLKR